MLKNGFEKTVEELFKERADVLYRTGAALSDALREVTSIEKKIEDHMEALKDLAGHDDSKTMERIYAEANREISRYNRARESAKVRYHYLIITREAMGIRRHTWVEEIYRIPPRKQPLSRARG